MRITNGMMINNMMSNLNSNLNRLSKYNDQGASGRLFNKPSDDPIGMSKSLKLYTDVSKIEQYERNLRDADAWMKTTENALEEMGEIIQRTREISVSVANGTNTQTDSKAIAQEVKQLKEQMIKLGNTRHAGRSIFTGHKTNEDLFEEVDGKIKYKIAVSQKDLSVYNVGISEDMEINIIGSKIFGNMIKDPNDTSKEILEYGGNVAVGDEPYLLNVFDNIISAMGAGENSEDFNQAETSKSLDTLDAAFTQILGVRAEIGAKTNRLEMTEKRLSSEALNFQSALSQNEDVDYAELIMKTKLAENVYNASLAIGSKIIQPSLMDFLR